jgi:hypothetical protein
LLDLIQDLNLFNRNTITNYNNYGTLAQKPKTTEQKQKNRTKSDSRYHQAVRRARVRVFKGRAPLLKQSGGQVVASLTRLSFFERAIFKFEIVANNIR